MRINELGHLTVRTGLTPQNLGPEPLFPFARLAHHLHSTAPPPLAHWTATTSDFSLVWRCPEVHVLQALY
jgi:hypothetical protein